MPDRNAILHIPHNLSVRRSYDGTGGYQIAWGQGSQREYFQTHSPDLAACLATMPSPLTIEEADSRLITELGLDRDAATDLVRDSSATGTGRSRLSRSRRANSAGAMSNTGNQPDSRYRTDDHPAGVPG